MLGVDIFCLGRVDIEDDFGCAVNLGFEAAEVVEAIANGDCEFDVFESSLCSTQEPVYTSSTCLSLSAPTFGIPKGRPGRTGFCISFSLFRTSRANVSSSILSFVPEPAVLSETCAMHASHLCCTGARFRLHDALPNADRCLRFGACTVPGRKAASMMT